jgi:hypothetical protein
VSDTPWLETTFRVGKRRVTLTLPRKPADDLSDILAMTKWHPRTPTRRLNKKDLRAWKQGVRLFVEEISAQLGEPIAIQHMEVTREEFDALNRRASS